MGGRYLISGAQLGSIQELIRQRQGMKAIKELKNVEENQFLTDSDKPIQEDLAKYQELIKE